MDGTNTPHYLHHLSDPAFASAWLRASCREDRHVVLNCMATGSFWTREAFDAVADFTNPQSGNEHPRIYLEMDLPTTAHHIGHRVRDIGEQNRFVNTGPKAVNDLSALKSQGAWRATAHPRCPR